MSKLICDFCGATDTKANPVITGDNACICKACVGAAYDIMSGDFVDGETNSKPKKVENLKSSLNSAICEEIIFHVSLEVSSMLSKEEVAKK